MAADEVPWGGGGGGGEGAGGGGSSLELIDPRSNHRLAYNWADSDETGKAPWTNIEAVGVLDNGGGYNGGPIGPGPSGPVGGGGWPGGNNVIRAGASGAHYISHSDV